MTPPSSFAPRTFWLFSAFCVLTMGAQGIEIHLQPNSSPIQLAEALQKIRDARKSGDQGPSSIFLSNGDYPIESPLILEADDSHLSILAEPDAFPRIHGGKQIKGFQVGTDGIWTTKLDPSWRFEALWVNGARAVRAQTPNTGFIAAQSPGITPIEGIPLAAPAVKTLITVKPEDAAILAGLSPDELKEVQVSVYHSWDMSRLRLAGVRAQDGTLQFTGGVRNLFELEPWHRLRFENYRAALDAPGEWFLAKDGTLSYIPLPGETPEKTEVIAPITPQWLVLKGDIAANRFVKNITFKGVKFAFQHWSCPDKGIHAGQAEANLGTPAIEANGVHQIRFENCEFTHNLTHTAWLKQGCQDAMFSHCYFHDIGAGGVYVGDPGVNVDGPKHTHHVTLDNCIMRGGGRVFPAGIGVTLFHASDCLIRHCDIGDFYYSAISIGWTWGYKPTVAGRNTVEFNHLHHLGWGVLSDMGAVYTLGSQLGTVVKNNHIHDIGCASYGAWGMYNDEGSTGVLWENNLVHDTQTAGYHQHYGRGNLVRNNILAWGKEEHLRWSRPEEALGFAFERNIVLLGEGKLLTHADRNWLNGRVFLADNVYWRKNGPQPDFAGKNWNEWQALGNDVRSVVADPLFKNPEDGDWSLAPESPALKLGFVPFPWKEAGVEGDPDWKAIPQQPLPPMVFGVKPKPVSFQISETFEDQEVGKHPRVVQKHPKKPALFVVEGVPDTKGRCLEMRDGPNEQPAYEPHFHYSPHHTSGVSRISFDLRVEPEFHFVHEWRDGGNPYITGAFLSVKDGVIKAGSQKLADFPSNKWVRVEVEAQVGIESTGEYSVTLTPRGGEPQKFEGLKFPKGALKEFAWAGFIGAGTLEAKAWLDNIEVRNK